MRVIGTAGHVDHGKSVLVEALTGIDPDRLKEEKERGMTIDLGFAWLTLPSGQTVSIVDVPGHEDFVRNMLAGVGGIDAALLVVAADEGAMPQTREHLAILDLLQVKSSIVALTKIDLMDDPEWLELVEADVTELLEGTCLEGAEIVPVSARTGQGLETLVMELDRLLAATAPRLDLGRPRLPIDRIFSIAGFGTVVTGTLVDGRFRVGQEVEIFPQSLKARIRGLQTHKQKIEEAMPGSRVAINLTGVSTDQLQRGDVVTTPDWLEPTQLIDVRLQLLSDAPKPLKHNVEVEFFSGSAQIMARVRLLGARQVDPGGMGWAQLRLAQPTAVVKNDRFIIRQPSPSLTIGGGVIVNPHPRRRYRRFRPEVTQRLETLTHGTPEEILLEALRRQEPCPARELVQRSGLPKGATQEALGQLLAAEQVLVLDAEGSEMNPQALASNSKPLISISGWAALMDRMAGLLGEYHRQYSLRAGMPRGELKSRLRLETRLFNEVVELAARQGRVALNEATLRLPEHEVRFNSGQQCQIERLLAAFERNRHSPPKVVEAQGMVGEEVLNALVEQGMLVKVSEDICFLSRVYEGMVRRVVDYIKVKGSITVREARDMFRSSRKYILPFLEYLDDRRVTKRIGDERVLR